MYDQFFQKYQKQLLEVANSKSGRASFFIPGRERIVRLQLNSYTTFQGHIKQGKLWIPQYRTHIFQRAQHADMVFGGHKNTPYDPSILTYVAKKSLHTNPYGIYDQIYRERGILKPGAYHYNTTVTSSAGDGGVYATSATYATARGAAAGVVLGDTGTTSLICDNEFNAGVTYILLRGYLPFVFTAGWLGTDTITSADILLYVTATADAETDTIGFAMTTQAATGSLATTDYAAITLNSPTEVATRVTIASLSINTQKAFALNAAGIAALPPDAGGNFKLGCRTGQEIDGTAPTVSGGSNVTVAMSENATPANRPQVGINHSLPVASGSTGFMTTNTGFWGA